MSAIEYFLAVLLAMATGTLLYFKLPWPVTAAMVPQTWNEYFLRLIALQDPWTYAGLTASYHVMLFTNALHRIFVFVVCLVHLHAPAEASRKATGSGRSIKLGTPRSLMPAP